MMSSRKRNPEEKINKILQTVHVMIGDVGLRHITLRAVAKACGIHLKTLQHYFPTKDDLMRAIYEERIALYLPPLVDILNRPEPSLHRFNLILDQLFGFVQNLENQRFFFEVFSMAQDDPEWMILLEQKFEAFYNRIGDLLADLNPCLDRAAGRKRALAMGAMMEGMMLFVGDNKIERPERDGLEDELRGLLLLMAQAPLLKE